MARVLRYASTSVAAFAVASQAVGQPTFSQTEIEAARARYEAGVVAYRDCVWTAALRLGRATSRDAASVLRAAGIRCSEARRILSLRNSLVSVMQGEPFDAARDARQSAELADNFREELTADLIEYRAAHRAAPSRHH
jgi:hypothetical protein